MASINYHTREISCKIVYYGPGLSGKTTNLQIIHRKVPKENKSEMVSLATETDRTLFFDFLPLDLGSIKGFATKFQLYTVPGQVYYNATRKLVLRGVDGVVFVADSQRDKMPENLESLKNLEENLREYGIELRTTPFVLQYNKRDLPGIFTVEEMNAQINFYGVPAYEAQAHQGVGVFTTLKAIGKVVIDTFNTKYSSRQTSRRPEPASSTPPAPMPTIPPPPAPVGLHMPPPPAPIAAPESHGSRSGFIPPMPPRPVGPPPAPQPLRPTPPPAVLPPPVAPAPAWPAAAAIPSGSFAPPPPAAPQPIQPRPMTPPQMPTPIPPPPASAGVQSALVGGYGMDLPPAAPPPAQSIPTLSTTGFAPPPPPAAGVNPIPGLQSSYFQPPQPQQQAPAAPIPAAPRPNAPTFRKGRLDGTMDAKELEEEIARMERELHNALPPVNPPAAAPSVMPPPAAAPAPAARPSEPFQFNPPVNADPAFSDAFLSPEEIRQFQQNSHDYPTQRLPMNPGNGQA